MAVTRATGSSSGNILADLKSSELFKKVCELDCKALQTVGQYRADYENNMRGNKKSDLFIPFKSAPIKKAYFIGLALFFVYSWIEARRSSAEAEKSGEPASHNFDFFLSAMAAISLFAGLVHQTAATWNINQFHKRLKPEIQKNLKDQAFTYLHERVTLFAQDPESSTDVHRTISREINYDLLRLLVDCYRTLDANQLNLLAITNMIDEDFIYITRHRPSSWNVLQDEYNNLRIEKRQHIRF